MLIIYFYICPKFSDIDRHVGHVSGEKSSLAAWLTRAATQTPEENFPNFLLAGIMCAVCTGREFENRKKPDGSVCKFLAGIRAARVGIEIVK